MAIDLHEPRPRRALLAGIGGGVAAVVASAVGKAPPVRAANGDPVLLGNVNTATAVTRITQGSAADEVGLIVSSVLGSGTAGSAIEASSTNGIGIVGGSSTNSGVRGQSTSGAALEGLNDSTTNAAIIGNSASHFAAIAGYLDMFPTVTPPAGTAIFGNSEPVDDGTAVWGRGAITQTSSSFGVIGEGNVGVLGSSAAVGGFGMLGETFADGVGVYGSASNSVTPGVYSGAGVIGQADAGGTAIVGFTGPTEPLPTPDVGIYGRSDTGGINGRGLVGFCYTGIGLLGQTASGTGIRAFSGTDAGLALRVTGKAAFDRSGKLTVGASTTTVTKTAIALTSASFILATLQTNVAGLFVQSVVTNVAGSSFTIRLNKAPGVSVSVAWLAVN